MVTNSPRPAAPGPASSDQPAPAKLVIDWRAVTHSERACCCPSRPAVIAAMPTPPDRLLATELLLCGHHYRRSRAALAAAGAIVLDPSGAQVTALPAWLDD
jgi:hypothetical protein